MRNALVRRHPSVLGAALSRATKRWRKRGRRDMGPSARSRRRVRSRTRAHRGGLSASPPTRSGASLAGLLQRALEVVEAVVPALLVRAHGLFVPQVAVGEANGGHAAGFLEV